MTNHSQNASVQPERRSIVVLLVDDQRFVGMAVGHLLAPDKDIELHCCYAAADAVEQANRLMPDVILQDLVMPDIDGATVVGLFRSNPATAGTPIIVLSGNDDAATRSRAMAAGANDYLVKLPDRDTLVACIRRHHESGRAAASAPDAVVPATSADGNVNETLDRAVIAELREVGGANGAGFVTSLIDQFIQEAEVLVERLRLAVRKMDTSALKAASHSLKGASQTMGARRLAALNAQLEEQVSQPGVSVDLMLIVSIDEEFVRVKKACLQERTGERSLA